MEEKMRRMEEQLSEQQHRLQEQEECQCLLDLKNAQNQQLVEELRSAPEETIPSTQRTLLGSPFIDIMIGASRMIYRLTPSVCPRQQCFLGGAADGPNYCKK
ncbi:hypothetical protein PVK06_017877 [Gossypium arboreum]|uniref:Uncharacterized protein n=1 Tax=Gossypium arboreum TaxID=29729 RepID=A0ABR0Q542_GOSAR|nr:hypothetical protein PVK06_017877 [Gossypium arboreum]